VSWIDKVKEVRGIVTHRVDSELEYIASVGTPKFKSDVRHNKSFGVKMAADMVMLMDHEQQDEFVKWKNIKHRTLKDIKTYMLQF